MASNVLVNIKMYRVGELGDCFLLKFSNAGQKSHVLIDCGSFRNSNESKARMRLIAEDIKNQLGGQALDVVVGTHQHNDHLSGFVHAEDIFRSIEIEQVWLPWLDDPTNPLAKKIQEEHRKLIGLISNFPSAFQVDSSYNKEQNHQELAESIEEILQFYGIDDTAHGVNEGDPLVPAKGIKILKEIGKNEPPQYLSPGQVFDLPGLAKDTVKVYVLGPPKVEKDIKDTSPNASETFDHGLALALEQTEHFLSALSFNMVKKAFDLDKEEHFPFNERKKIYVRDECFRPDMDKKLVAEMQAKIKKSKVFKQYNDQNEAWRKIDSNWIEQAETLALYLHDLTNNSSLVLAFELVKTKKVLLFVGDAQTGNWRSWASAAWPVGTPPNILDRLLGNTVFYKVGHHASHNATYKPAFEKMKHQNLMAMIPVDKNDPNISSRKKPWKMPAKNLYEVLKTQTQHRILRMDEVIPEDCQGKNPAWEQGILANDLFIECTIK